jgi:hypothetical protein
VLKTVLAEFFAVVIAILGDFGFQKTAMTAAFGLDFFRRKNEPGGRTFARHAQHFVQVVLFAGGVEIGLPGGNAFGEQIIKGLCATELQPMRPGTRTGLVVIA